MKYCSHCAGTINRKIPENDHVRRDVCQDCGHIFYQNPLIVAGCIVEHEDSILLCRRDIEPRLGFWTIPGGFMELDETTAQGAARETYEEALAEVEITRLHGVYNIPRVNQVYFVYRGQLKGAEFGVTYESSEVALFKKDEIPWDEMAFGVIKQTLSHYYKILDQNEPAIHLRDLV